VVIVIGGAHSNNTRELVATSSRYCSRVHHVQTAADLRPEWFTGTETVGITAGTSTPDAAIEDVELRLGQIAWELSKTSDAGEDPNMRGWLNYFERNRKKSSSRAVGTGTDIDTQLRGPLIRSLQKFQLGESGEGRRLRRHAAATGNPVYAAAIDLFVKEEQEHARLMGEILRLLDAALLKSDWTDNCFILLRHLFGLRQELMCCCCRK